MAISARKHEGYPLTEEAFAEALVDLRSTLISYACRTRPCPIDDAEDLVGEAVRLALLVLERFNPDSCSLETWMTGILKVAILQDRRKATQRPITVPLIHAISIPSYPALPLRDAVQPHIDALPLKYRLIVRDHLDGYSQVAIARQYRIHPNTVANRMEMAEQMLKCSFPDFEGDWDAGLLNFCSKTTLYHKPVGVWKSWMHSHPPDRVFRFFHYKRRDGSLSRLQMRATTRRTPEELQEEAA